MKLYLSYAGTRKKKGLEFTTMITRVIQSLKRLSPQEFSLEYINMTMNYSH